MLVPNVRTNKKGDEQWTRTSSTARKAISCLYGRFVVAQYRNTRKEGGGYGICSSALPNTHHLWMSVNRLTFAGASAQQNCADAAIVICRTRTAGNLL